MGRRADRLLKKLDWKLQSKLEHLTDAALQSSDGVQSIVRVLDQLSGEREGDDVRRAVRAAIFDYQRKSDESLLGFVLRRETQFDQAATHGLDVPSAIRGVLLEEGANLSAQGSRT